MSNNITNIKNSTKNPQMDFAFLQEQLTLFLSLLGPSSKINVIGAWPITGHKPFFGKPNPTCAKNRRNVAQNKYIESDRTEISEQDIPDWISYLKSSKGHDSINCLGNYLVRRTPFSIGRLAGKRRPSRAGRTCRVAERNGQSLSASRRVRRGKANV